MNKVALYCRVSTIEQTENFSIGEQIDKLTKYCEIKDWKISETYVDGGYSGSNINRPSIERLIDDVKLKKFDTVLVYKLDRLSRSQKDTLYLIEDVFLKNSIDFISLNENFDTSSPFGKAMIGILSVFAQLEREQIKERMTMGKVGRAKSGKPMMWSKVAFGYLYDKDYEKLIINDLQANIVRQIFRDYLDGVSITKLRDRLNDDGYIGKDIPWSYRTLKNVLENPVYCGLNKYKENIYQGTHEAIISKQDYETTQVEIKKRQVQAYEFNHNSRPFQSKYMLSGLAKCGYCGSPLHVTLGHIKKDGTRRKKYQCINRFPRKTAGITIYNDNKKCDSGFYELEDLENEIIKTILSFQIDNKMIEKAFSPNAPTAYTDIVSIQKEILKIDKKIKKHSDLYLNDFITMDELKKRTDELQNDKNKLNNKIKNDTILLHEKDVPKIIGSKPFDKLDYSTQKAVVNELVKKIYVTDSQIEIEWDK